MYDRITGNIWAKNFCTSASKSISAVLLWKSIPYSAKFWREENFGEFGETIITRQYFTQPNSRFTVVTNGSYCKFANVFLAKTLKRSIPQSFTPPTFCEIRYISKNIQSQYISKYSATAKSYL